MKRQSFLLFACLFSLLLSASRCKKDRFELPPETTTGANTFGCKVNGKVFVPRSGNGRPGLFCQYVYLGEGEGGGWFLNIPAVDWKASPNEIVSIATDSLLIEEGVTYEFKNQKGYPQAFYFKSEKYLKRDTASGKLHITKQDRNNRILSGTFEFVGTNNTGESVNVTEGRFDILY
ncbi:MAG: hypothetical protein J0I84_15400 [Terrimonas sp.]|nr:hypothetical protein [Terrimonas sp.]OJY93329.1 MAG: hypothetical protein BGP13_17020 [Sphingobacteriales bacterium 40-81]